MSLQVIDIPYIHVSKSRGQKAENINLIFDKLAEVENIQIFGSAGV